VTEFVEAVQVVVVALEAVVEAIEVLATGGIVAVLVESVVRVLVSAYAALETFVQNFVAAVVVLVAVVVVVVLLPEILEKEQE
jgi:hypothetical protein